MLASIDNALIQRDLQHVWHPCSQMQDFAHCPPLVIHKAQGSYLYTDQGPIIDGISSWWCKTLGHGHPAIIANIKAQLSKFEHVIAANTTHPTLVMLAEKLAAISNKQHTFFASDGASAVEISLKLALHARQLQGQPQRNLFVALEQSYHGETLASLSISDLGLFKKPYVGYGVPAYFLHSIPYVAHPMDPQWANIEDHIWETILQQLLPIKEQMCAIIIEPIIQGAAGMRCYSADFLKKIAAWAHENDIYIIADEIMTGFARTGKWLASEYANVNADLICVSKGLTAGTLPLSAVLVDHSIYELFYADYKHNKSFLHSHTYSGNALAVSAALSTIQVIEEENINEQANNLGSFMYTLFQEIAAITGSLHNIRTIGAIVAGDLQPHPGKERLGYHFFVEALKLGALLRPLNNTIYWLPPVNTDYSTIEKLAEITLHSIRAIYKL